MSLFMKQRSCQTLSRLFASLLLFLITAVPLHAHHLPPGMEDVDEFEEGAAFMAGLRHPLLGTDHWLFAIAVGVAATVGVSRFARVCPVASLLAGVIGGATLGLSDVIFPSALMAGMAVLMAVIVMLTSRMHWFVLKLILIGLVAFWQGNQHGIAWPLESGGVEFVVGLLVTTITLAFGGAALLRLAPRTARLARLSRVTSH